jgi:hypothetical protein
MKEFQNENENILLKFLNFNEAFIKEKAIFLLFKDYAFKYEAEKVNKLIQSLEHP